MARSSGQIIQNRFVKGLVTEATGLNFPEDSCQETWDCVFDKTGKVTRRLGFEYENGWVSNDNTGATLGVKNEFLWKNAGSAGITNIIVVQEGDLISFYLPDSAGRISANKHATTVNLFSYDVAGATVEDINNQRADFATGNGRLFVQHPACDPIYIEYDDTTSTFTVTQYELLVRDLSGIDDDLDFDERPTTLTLKHKYNLKNQGWYISAQCGTGRNSLEDLGVQNVLDFWAAYRDDYPSNADVWWLYKDTNDRFNNKHWDTVAVGNSPAPRGHYIDNPFYFDRAAVSSTALLAEPVKTSGKVRPSCVAFFAGRVWYGGVNSGDYVGKIYYTQVIESVNEIGRCYQKNDPTDENLNDLLDTDGGVVDILDANNILKMIPIQNYLFVFAENGVWLISGSQGAGFVATDYSVARLSTIPVISAYSFVMVDGYPVWFNNEGIFTISPENATFTVKNLTEETIKTFYQEILAANLRYAKGAYSPSRKLVQWIYRSTTANTFEENFVYDKVLTLNTVTGAFYPWTISTANPKVRGIVVLDSIGAFLEEQEVANSAGEIVVNSGAVTVVANSLVVSGDLLPQFSYYVTGTIATVGTRSTFAQASNASYVDWQIESAVDYTSYFLTGAQVHAEGDKPFTSEYITIFSNTETDSSFYVQGRWDWSNSGNSGKWSPEQQGYSERDNRDVQRRRLLIRGFGPALQLYFRSEDGKPFNILGWSAWETANART